MGLEQTEQSGALHATLLDARAAQIVSDAWRTISGALPKKPPGQIKTVVRGVFTTLAIAAFAGLWVADEYWPAADNLINRGK